MKIILGSQSKQRQQVLKDMGYEFETIAGLPKKLTQELLAKFKYGV